MSDYSKYITMVPSGDSRQNRNRTTWPAQVELEQAITSSLHAYGFRVDRALPYNPELGHGYIFNQRMGMDVFRLIQPNSPLIVAIAAWQYSHHILAGLRDHLGPILTVANWSGLWPGLVGLLNLNACLTKIGKPYSTIWSTDFKDEFFRRGIEQWLNEGRIDHDNSHVRELQWEEVDSEQSQLAEELANQIRSQKAIIGVFDEGCMGMYNAIVDDELLNPLGIYKERLSQSALLAEMQRVDDLQASQVRTWLESHGMHFQTGPNHESDLTDDQIHQQCKMYIAALNIADEFGLDAIGIQYQQGLKDMAPASDLVEGLLNNPDRPPVNHPGDGRELYAGKALPHFNEVDECAAIDLLVTNQVWTALGLNPSATIHDIRWGEHYQRLDFDEFVWVFMISGAAPASHFIDGYAGVTSARQPPAGFPSGGGTMKGISKPGEVVWSRIFIEEGQLKADLGMATVVELPYEETQRRWQSTTPVWPIMHAVLHGISRDQMMARHKSNHITVAYAPDTQQAGTAFKIKSAMLARLGIQVHWCGL